MWFLALGLALSLGDTGANPIQSRIIGGWPCKNQHPWQVSLYSYNKHECGGVLIDPKWVLTAAHCKSDLYQIWLGLKNLEEPDETTQYAQVSLDIQHPQYNVSHMKNPFNEDQYDYSDDIMLLRLKEPVQLTDTVQVLELPTKPPEEGSVCIASGWGSLDPNGTMYPDELQCLNLEVKSNEVCAEAYAHLIADSMLCAKAPRGKDTCVGDSGGPLLCDGMLQGITSWGSSPCAARYMPAVFTRVYAYNDWIRDTMAANP
ncbi:PREDICTED: kallikrein-1 [Elephantulus edwardii]|uniref:kallikrein-1 n=1 Tax=Elephantulus edwardii TaxID=28737 RepID=UPI0003F0DBF3|nr:PREDICTED: kallikrein-1 [Elephantulus edwardii]